MANWQGNLEIIGAELFQRYRKRLMENGIMLEIWRDYPGLSLADLWVRVHAGRRLLQDGDDFVALQAIRDGSWDAYRRSHAARIAPKAARPDRMSPMLVNLGAVIFAVFCVLMLLGIGVSIPGFAVVLSLTGVVGVVWIARRWNRRPQMRLTVGDKACGGSPEAGAG